MANLEQLHGEIVRKLTAEYRFVQSGDHLIKGVCPECGKKELFTKFDKPYYITCNRRSKCQYETTVRYLIPELFENVNEKYPPTDIDPNATAKAYLSLIRGFDVDKMAGWFEQGHYYRSNGNRTTATVKFFLTQDRTVVQTKGERRIADWLTAHGIVFRYDDKFQIIHGFAIRPDFYLPELDVYVEYWGMDTTDYKIGMLHKQRLYQQEGKRLISLYPGNLPSLDRYLMQKLAVYGYHSEPRRDEQSESSRKRGT